MSVIYTSGGASVNDATTTVSGKVRLATIAEAGGTSESIAVTPAGLQAEISGIVVGTQYQGAVAYDAISTTLVNASVGDMYRLSSSGSAHGYDWTIGDLIIVNADMGGTFDANKIDRFDTTDADLATVATTGSYNDLLNQPSIPSASTDLSDTASLVRTTDLATVATSGSYNDLSDQPSIPSASTDLSDTASLVRTTDLATVATSGSYNDLLNQPSIPASSDDITSDHTGVNYTGALNATITAHLSGIDTALASVGGGGGGGYTYSAITADPANAQANYHYSCTGTFTITLPTSGMNAGEEIRVKNMGSGTITIDPQTSQIDGSTTDYVLSTQYSAITLISTGTNWEII